MKICENPACAGKGRAVKTDRTDCIMCSRPMKDTRALLDDLLGKAEEKKAERQEQFMDTLDEMLHKRR